MLQIHFSNRLEVLREALLAELGRTTGGVFEPQEVIVASAAMQRHLSLAVADAEGICANLRFSFLAQWLWSQIGRWVPGVAAQSPFAPAVLGWRVLEAFGDNDFLAAEPRLGDYLREADEAMRYELAVRCAMLIEQYITYRPDWLQAWSDGATATAAHPEAHWQAALWRRLAAELGSQRRHPALAFLAQVERAGAAAAGLPGSAHVFALPAIPPLYLGLLQQLSRWVDLHLYVLNPCREYWFDLIEPRRLGELAVAGDTGHHEVGHPLLARWGRQTQAQLGLLLGQAGETASTDERYVTSDRPSLLARLQNAILDLAPIEPAPLAEDDRSIELHVCHSLLRELEVLQSRLLALFAGDDPPQPADIAVVMPDLDAAAPLIEAVFGTAPAERFIPYVVSGRSRSRHNPAAQALLGLLSLAASRWRASEVVDLLQQPLVGRGFGFEGDAALAGLRGWLDAAGIRWGFDAAHRARLDLPPSARHGFDDGLQRLYLGYALPDAVDTPFLGRLPAGAAEGSAAAALGGLQRFVDALAGLQRALARPLDGDSWLRQLDAAIDDFLQPAGAAEEEALTELRSVLRELHRDWQQAQFEGRLTLDVLRLALTRRLDDPARGSMPAGVVTFAPIGGLRHLPFRVVCAINLDDGLFPSPSRAPEFDLMAAAPRPGDRQRRGDERNLFLDLVLAARERLHLGCTGRSARDNAALPPSVLVAELLDALLPAIADEPPSAGSLAVARRRLVVEHPLQPFTAASFDASGDPRRLSFDRDAFEALQQPAAAAASADLGRLDLGSEDEDALFPMADTAAAPPFFAGPLAEPDASWRRPTLQQLGQFFANPCRYLLERRLGIALERAEDELLDDEPLLADFAGRRALTERLLPQALQGAAAGRLRELALAGGDMPAGRFGERLLERELQALQRFAAGVAAATASPLQPPFAATLAFDLDGTDWQLQGELADLRPDGLVRWRCDEARPHDLLKAWLAHLWLCASRPPDVAPRTAWHARDGVWRFEPVEGAQGELAGLLRLYRDGLREPLHFYPKSAWRYIDKGGSLAEAQGAWNCTRYRPFGEGADAAYRLALRGTVALDDAFERCAAAVYAPLRAHAVPPA